jgi:hypothetical protein
VTRNAADEVVLAGGLERDGGGSGAVAAQRLAGGAGGVGAPPASFLLL